MSDPVLPASETPPPSSQSAGETARSTPSDLPPEAAPVVGPAEGSDQSSEKADEIELAAIVEPETKVQPFAVIKRHPKTQQQPIAAPPRKSSLFYPGFHKRPGLR